MSYICTCNTHLQVLISHFTIFLSVDWTHERRSKQQQKCYIATYTIVITDPTATSRIIKIVSWKYNPRNGICYTIKLGSKSSHSFERSQHGIQLCDSCYRFAATLFQVFSISQILTAQSHVHNVISIEIDRDIAKDEFQHFSFQRKIFTAEFFCTVDVLKVFFFCNEFVQTSSDKRSVSKLITNIKNSVEKLFLIITK